MSSSLIIGHLVGLAAHAGQPSLPPVSCGTIQEEPPQNHTPGDSSQGSPRQALPQQKHQPEKGHLFALQLRASALCPLWPLGFRLPEAGNSQGGFGGFVPASSSPQRLRERPAGSFGNKTGSSIPWAVEAGKPGQGSPPPQANSLVHKKANEPPSFCSSVL